MTYDITSTADFVKISQLVQNAKWKTHTKLNISQAHVYSFRKENGLEHILGYKITVSAVNSKNYFIVHVLP
jgi:hypothetical protein